MDPADLELLNERLESESQLREKIKEQVLELDKKSRVMLGHLNKVHSIPSSEVPNLLASVRPVLESTHSIHQTVSQLVPAHQFWRWKDMWTNGLRSFVFVAAFVQFLTDGTLLSLADTTAQLGIKDEWKDRFALPVEDYLHGLITLVNELSRLAVNSVTLGNFEEPLKISAFVKDIFSGFTMLNLKNDLLRRRFDSLKYDVKKIEEIVYDVSLRKLAPKKAVSVNTSL
ncbi:translin [Cylindrobasidium torrendii FP15055 ss-10]|uniref:Translin n=1 Tax=Cylindrobasidium torrendii FP15055 ss-10 TaxID=1314674 RepID=A0A0D7BEZ5_9AGAR|nr:translin [Cylindrobasidium torrendii FP15055 ss-10]